MKLTKTKFNSDEFHQSSNNLYGQLLAYQFKVTFLEHQINSLKLELNLYKDQSNKEIMKSIKDTRTNLKYLGNEITDFKKLL